MKAIIIGATSGIGRAITEQLAAKGWQLGIAGSRLSNPQRGLNIIRMSDGTTKKIYIKNSRI